VVAVVVTVYTAGAAGTAMMSTVQAGGATAFASTATVVGGATGAITGGLAGRFGSIAEALGSNSYGQATALALANAGGNYAGQKLMGTDAGFSWRSIAASAVGSLVSAKVTPGLVDKMRIQDKFGYDFASGMTGGMVSAGVRSSFGQTLRQGDYMAVVADAFGNALGNQLVRGGQQSLSATQASVGLDTRYSLASNGSAGTGGMAYPEELWREITGAAAEGPRIVDMERITVRPDPELLQGSPYTAGVLESVQLARFRAEDRPRSNAIDFSVFNDSNAVNAGPSPRPSVVSAAPRYQPASVQPQSIIKEPMGLSIDLPPNPLSDYMRYSLAVQDQGLLALKAGMNWLRKQSRGLVENATSPWEAGVGSVLYAINSITDAVVAGTVDSARIVTNAQERAQFFQGMEVLFTTNPVTTASAAWNHWAQLPTEDRLISGAALLVSLPKGVTSASVLADIIPAGSAAGHVAPKAMIGATSPRF